MPFLTPPPVAALDIRGAATAHGPNAILGRNTVDLVATDVTSAVIVGTGQPGYNNVVGGDGSATVGTVTPNTAVTGTNASVSVVGGYDNVAGALSSKIVSDHSYVGVDAVGGHNCIYGGSNDIIDGASAIHAGIFNGYQCHVSSTYGFAEGAYNTVAGTASSGIAMGDYNTVSGTRGIAMGATNTVTGSYGVAHGQLCQVDLNNGTAQGQYAYARNPGQRAIASGRIAALGDTQTSVSHLYRQTTSATETKLQCAASAPDWLMVRGQTVLVECTFVARSVGGSISGAWKVTTVAHWESSGASANLGAATVETFYSTGDTLAVRVDAVSSIGAILPKVTGVAGTTINWSARMTTTEVMA